MNSAFRISILAAIALACIDAEAKPAERCILSLEASPLNAGTQSETMRDDPYSRPRCPLAVVYSGRQASRTEPRGQRLRSSIVPDDEARLDEPIDAKHDPAAPPRPALHV